MKQITRSYCWWPRINRDIKHATQKCYSFPKPQYRSWEEPERVWSRIHVDFAGPIWNTKWLIVADAK
jgi:hypothetical protein